MKMRVTQSKEIEIEIVFPYFVGSNTKSIKFIDERTAIVVDNFSNAKIYGIEKTVIIPSDWYLLPQITEDEFIERYNEALTILMRY